MPVIRRTGNGKTLELTGAVNNLQNRRFDLPLGTFSA